MGNSNQRFLRGKCQNVFKYARTASALYASNSVLTRLSRCLGYKHYKLQFPTSPLFCSQLQCLVNYSIIPFSVCRLDSGFSMCFYHPLNVLFFVNEMQEVSIESQRLDGMESKQHIDISQYKEKRGKRLTVVFSILYKQSVSVVLDAAQWWYNIREMKRILQRSPNHH